MQIITPHLWFSNKVKEAAEFYTSIFDESEIKSTFVIESSPSESVEIFNINLLGMKFKLIGAKTEFKFNPSISFVISSKDIDEVENLWSKLIEGGMALMDLGEYPFSKKFGWVQDKYGVSWQLMLDENLNENHTIVPMILFVEKNCGKAEEAVKFYTSVFSSSKIENIQRYGKSEEPDSEGSVKQASFKLENQDFMAVDSAYDHKFVFNEAISFVVNCDTQDEIDYYWDKLSGDPKEKQSGWLKDKYGLSWVITPTIVDDLFTSDDAQKINNLFEILQKMKKINISELSKVSKSK